MAKLPTDMHMAVNVSAAQFASGRLLSCVCAALAEHQLDPRRIMLEITETAILKRTPETVNQLRLLRSLGVGLAIDDFGEGH
ncbi:EAL domain-containing protein, partial [Acinetobacter baumannii]